MIRLCLLTADASACIKKLFRGFTHRGDRRSKGEESVQNMSRVQARGWG